MIASKALAASLLAGVLLAGCTMNQSERRAVMGGAIGGAGGAAVGDMTGLGMANGALLGGAGGALLGAVTAPSREVHNHYRHEDRRKKRWKRHDD